MKKIKKVILCLLTLCCVISFTIFRTTSIKAFSISPSDFKPYDNAEQKVGRTPIGYALNGGFFETITRQRIGSDPNTGYEKWRFRHYVTHRGNSGSYIYQKVPVDFYVDGRWQNTDYNPQHVSNGTFLWGEFTMTLSPGWHTINFVDAKPGAIVVVNTKFDIYIDVPRYTVNFIDYNGTLLKQEVVSLNGNATPPPDPSLTGYRFVGWQGDYHNVKSDRTIIAQYNINQYTVNFLDYDNRLIKQQTVNYNGNASPPPNPTRTGYTFTGWEGNYNNVTSNRSVVAKYKINTYSIVFNSNGGTPVWPVFAIHGDTIQKPPNPTRDKDKFMGWYTDTSFRNKFDFTRPITQNYWLNAKWDKPPVIKADDMTIFEDMYNKMEWEKVRKENAVATDYEDGDISSKIKVTYDNTNLSQIGEYKMRYEVTDSAGNKVTKEIKVTVIDDRAIEDRTTKYIRSINSKYRDTLKPNSIWRLDSMYSLPLNATLDKADNATPKYKWVLNARDIKDIKVFNQTHDYSKKSDEEFLQQFSYLLK